MTLLKIENLKKSYGHFQALKGVDINVEANEIYGFIGKNGAGKTTTLNAIMNFLSTDGGSIIFDGEPIGPLDTAYKEKVAFVPDVPAFPTYLTARETLKLSAELIGLDDKEADLRIQDAIKRTSLAYPDKKVGGYSRGMKQRLAIACALLKRPKLLLMDEPTSALDPVGRRDLLELVKSLKNETTILYSTHILSDAQSICDKIGLIDHGVMRLEGTVRSILSSRDPFVYIIESENLNSVFEALKRSATFLKSIRMMEGHLEMDLRETANQSDIFDFLKRSKIDIDTLARKTKNLDDVFVEVLDETITSV